jgi:hypothetical protein
MQVSRARLIALALGLATAALVFLLWPRSEPSAEELIERQVLQMARAAEKREVGPILEHISERFRSQQGWGKQELKGVLAAHLLRGQWVRVFTVNTEVKLLGPDEARFSGQFVFGRSQAERPQDLPKGSEIRAYDIEGTLAREQDGEWRFVSAKHRVVDATDLF